MTGPSSPTPPRFHAIHAVSTLRTASVLLRTAPGRGAGVPSGVGSQGRRAAPPGEGREGGAGEEWSAAVHVLRGGDGDGEDVQCKARDVKVLGPTCGDVFYGAGGVQPHIAAIA